MENMSFDDLNLLLGVIEIWVVLHILVHGLHDEFIGYSPCFLFYGLDHC
jgi:fumarate reductase subunit D